ncbi:NAD(+)/NADH kinase [Dorea acetigenes]|uniref:NAD kinase n=1 Tax=Dorea acetigenes TaxID=2981787 RepID=A0ABT2RPZ2_9FIRM|nr:NAD(+)/NADH kinase [Dorea acetigenes]MCB6413656.1 NAD(+)/NADH kinase [Faecalimonas umbilicata]MCU6687479.1 NAD(+)/NADH kinase [Dorea acetigenes]SCJ43757.1 Probable inorganic polyphosphate/ATP-NAD kinase [uncultured Clostridium sp.]
MERFFIVTNDGKDIGGRVTAKVKHLLEEQGKTCILCEKDEDKKIVKEKVPAEIDCAIVIGGDGTLIEVARMLRREIPILGINMGTLGYLTEVEVSGVEQAVCQMLADHYTIENRMMLQAEFEDGSRDIALNDIVVSRKNGLRLIHFDIYVNGSFLNSYEADGVILSTPTGSTAYNLSAGGPVVEPTASLIVITPICSHSLNTSSIVLSSEDEIVILIGEGRNGRTEEVYITFDGADMVELKTGQKLTVHKSESITQLMKLNGLSFLEILHRKMKGN